MTGVLLTDFAENYLHKLFYFCLKKTGNTDAAEELTQDISLQIVSAISNGTVPTEFSAWVWKIARNRYAAWAKDKRKTQATQSGFDIGDYEIADDGVGVLEGIIQSEQLSLLRRELAFIKRDYRELLVSYYVNNTSVKDIAAALSVSVDSVKQRLVRARKTLKEGMDMAREFGVRSYKPENISFAASGHQPSGLPWSAVQRAIPVNILLQASNNPSTLEELSMELGIALPYMEEEVELLRKATLLEKQGDKYITNFFILDKECRTCVYNALRKESVERSDILSRIIDDTLEDVRALCIKPEHISDNAFRWLLVPLFIDFCVYSIVDFAVLTETKRSNGESWGFVGYENVELPESCSMGNNGKGDGGMMFWCYKYDDYGMWHQCGEIEGEPLLLLADCLTNGRKTSSFSKTEQIRWSEGIAGKYAHADDEGNVIPDIVVFADGGVEKLKALFASHPLYSELHSYFKKAYQEIKGIFKKYSHEVLHDNLDYNIAMEILSARMMSVHDLVKSEYLIIPSDPKKSNYGMYIKFN